MAGRNTMCLAEADKSNILAYVSIRTLDYGNKYELQNTVRTFLFSNDEEHPKYKLNI